MDLMPHVIALTDYFRLPINIEAEAERHKEWHHFCIVHPEIQAISNLNLMRAGGKDGSWSARLIALAKEASWDGDVDTIPSRYVRARRGAIDLTFGHSTLLFQDGCFNLSLALENRPITRVYYRNGRLKKEITYKNGRKEGPARRLFKDGSSFEYECLIGHEKAGRWRNYDREGFLVMERVYTRTNDLLCELYYDYEENQRIVTLQWTKFLDDEIERYRQSASEYDKRGNPGFPFEKRSNYPSIGTHPHF